MDLSNASPPEGLQFFTNCPCMAFLWGSKPTPGWAPTSTGLQALPGTCYSMYFPQCYNLLQAATCCGMKSSRGCKWTSAPSWTFLGCRDADYHTLVFTKSCRGMSALAPGTSPVCPALLTFVYAGMFFTLPSTAPIFFPINTLSQSYCFCW